MRRVHARVRVGLRLRLRLGLRVRLRVWREHLAATTQGRRVWKGGEARPAPACVHKCVRHLMRGASSSR